MLLQEDVHSLLTPLFFLFLRCLQTLPVCKVILWQNVGFSFGGRVLCSSDFACYSYREALSLPLSPIDFKNKALSTEELRLQLLSPLVISLKGLL